MYSLAAILSASFFIFASEAQPYSRCVVQGDPHFYFFGNYGTGSTGHHYQGVDDDWYYVVPCKTYSSNPLVTPTVLDSSNRFLYNGNGILGLPFSIVGTHVGCIINGEDRSCIDDIKVNLYDDVGNLIYILTFNGGVGEEYTIAPGDSPSDTEPLDNGAAPYIINNADDEPFLSIGLDGDNNINEVILYDYSNVTPGSGDDPAEHLLFALYFTQNDIYPSVSIDVNQDLGYVYQMCGLCGTIDDTFGDFKTTGPPDRRLLQNEEEEETTDDTTDNTTITTINLADQDFRAHIFIEDVLGVSTIVILEDDGMISWSQMKAKGEVWELTMTYGDSWTVENEVQTNVSTTYFPSDDCIDVGTDLCTQFYQDTDEDSGNTCSQCDGANALQNENTALFIGFDNWLEGCIYDSCALANAAGMALELLTYEEALANGFFDAAAASCDALCDNNFGQCPSECTDGDGNAIACDCSQDANCQNCQAQGQCSQCKSGYFMASQDNHFCYPCQEYAGEGCMFCQNHNGCGQCAQGYTRTKDDTCSFNGNNLWYCV